MKKIFYVLLILFIASLLRLWNLNLSDVYEDEAHYINDGLRLHNRDPYMSLRYHTYRHPEPSIGHPMLVQLIGSAHYYFFQPSVVTARLPSAFAGIVLVGILFLFSKSFGGQVNKLAALFLAIVPIGVRYNRNAMLDSIFALILTAIALLMWHYINNPKKYFLLLAGILSGLALSTKLDGVFGLMIVILTLTFCRPYENKGKYFLDKLREFVFIFLPVIFIFLLFNDPKAYLDGILNPSFHGWDFTSLAFWKDRISINSVISLFSVSTDLLGPTFVVLYIFAVAKLLPNLKNLNVRFLAIWTISVLGVLLIHGFTVDSSYGWLTWTPPVTLTLSYFLSNSQIRYKKALVLGLILLTLPFTFIYGWRFERLPEHGIEYNVVYNRLRTDNFYQRVISLVNNHTVLYSRVLLLPQKYYPIFALRRDLSWSYSFSDKYDFYVLDKPITDQVFFENNEYFGSIESYQDGLELERFFYKRIDL